jgi:hypothetical protein
VNKSTSSTLNTPVVAAAALAMAGAAHAECSKESAFGFHKGMTLEQAQAVAPLFKGRTKGGYLTAKPPNPIYPFVIYGIIVGRTTGICAVTAMTEHKPFGSKALKDMAGVVIKMLSDRYGSPTHTPENDCTGEIRWTNPQGPRTALALIANHADDGTVYLSVQYEFSSLQKCREELLDAI